MNDDRVEIRPTDPTLMDPTQEPRQQSAQLLTNRDAVSPVGTLELREERVFVNKQREVAGTLLLTREVRRETVQVPVELVTEVLVIEHRGGDHAVSLDGELIPPGEKRELVVYREDAVVDKRVVVSEIVNVGKRVVTETRTFDATLSREELVVHEEGDVRRLSDVTSLPERR